MSVQMITLSELRDRLSGVVEDLAEIYQRTEDDRVQESLRPIRSELLDIHEAVHQLSMRPPWE